MGVIRAISSNPNDEIENGQLFCTREPNADIDADTNVEQSNDLQLNVPYKLKRTRSIDTLDRFVASIETAFVHEDEEDIDDVIFGTPWIRELEDMTD